MLNLCVPRVGSVRK